MELLKRLAGYCNLSVDSNTAPSRVAGDGTVPVAMSSFRVVLQDKGSSREPAGGGEATAGCSSSSSSSSSSSTLCDVIGGAPTMREARHVAAAMALELLLKQHPEAAEHAAAEARGEHSAKAKRKQVEGPKPWQLQVRPVPVARGRFPPLPAGSALVYIQTREEAGGFAAGQWGRPMKPIRISMLRCQTRGPVASRDAGFSRRRSRL